LKSTIIASSRITRSPNPSTQTRWSLEDWRRRPGSTSSPSRFTFSPHSLEGPFARVSIGKT
jgi:hypothetical protein